jgi:hypothetical protein
MTTKRVHAIRLKLHTQNDCSVIVWPEHTEKLCIQLMNPRRNWLTTQAGDSVWLKKNGDRTRQAVESVERYRVFPASENGRVVRSAWHWLNPGR